jgi:hypothetical protein
MLAWPPLRRAGSALSKTDAIREAGNLPASLTLCLKDRRRLGWPGRTPAANKPYSACGRTTTSLAEAEETLGAINANLILSLACLSGSLGSRGSASPLHGVHYESPNMLNEVLAQ